MDIIFWVAVYLLVGWGFAYWFRSHFLDDGRWSDGQEFGAGSAIMMNIVWIFYAIIMFMTFCIEHFPKVVVRAIEKVYGIK